MLLIFNNSWYPPSVVTSQSSSCPSTSSRSTSSSFSLQRPLDQPPAGMIVLLKDKIIDELQKLLFDKDLYNQVLLSLDQVKIQNSLRDELQKETFATCQRELGEGTIDSGTEKPFYSPASSLHRDGSWGFCSEIQETRTTYHRRALTHLAAKTSSTG
ncbi:hypothetical protein AAG906_010125 [Vitis piasezkii]